MAANWPVSSLESAGVSLIDCEHRTPDALNDGYPYVAIPQLRDGRIDVSTARRISHDDYVSWTRRATPREHDVLLSRRTNPGETAVVPAGLELAVGQNLVLLRADGTSVFPPYLRWLTRGSHWWGQVQRHLNVGAVFDSLKCADIPKFEVPLPPIPDQQAIARILGTLDDKIELNRRISETLEATARALFKSWFIDFDPVRAKVEMRETRLPPDLANLFPERLVDSAMGPIPDGWKAVPLPDLIEVNPSRPLRRGQVAPYLDMANMPTTGHSPGVLTERAFGSGMRFVNGDTLVARITPCLENGKTAYVDFLSDSQVGWGSTEYIVLRPRNPLPPEYAYCLARSSPFREFAIQRMTGSSGRQRVPAATLAHYLLPSPLDPVSRAFGSLVQPLMSRAAVAALDSRALAQNRDALLPGLVSGELRVREVDRILERTA